MSYLKAADVVSGQEAEALMTVHNVDGTTTVETMFWGRNLEAKIDVDKTDVYTLGYRGAQHKPNGWSGSGSMTIYHTTSIFRKMILQYIQKGIPAYFDIMVRNIDPASSIGAQTVLLKTCSLSNLVVAKFDVENNIMDENVDFTFDGFDIIEEYTKPVLGEL